MVVWRSMDHKSFIPQIHLQLVLHNVSSDQALLWHQWFDYPSTSVLERVVTLKFESSSPCEPCLRAKPHRSIYSLNKIKQGSSLLELIHSNIWGLTPIDSSKSKYFASFIDDFSRMTWIYLLKSKKSNVLHTFRSFHAWIKNNFNTSIGTFHSDNAKEYLSHAFTQCLMKGLH